MSTIKFVKTFSNRHLAGEYAETKVDIQKKSTNRLVSISGKWYTVITVNGETINFNGKRQFSQWAKSNEYKTDF